MDDLHISPEHSDGWAEQNSYFSSTYPAPVSSSLGTRLYEGMNISLLQFCPSRSSRLTMPLAS